MKLSKSNFEFILTKNKNKKQNKQTKSSAASALPTHPDDLFFGHRDCSHLLSSSSGETAAGAAVNEPGALGGGRAGRADPAPGAGCGWSEGTGAAGGGGGGVGGGGRRRRRRHLRPLESAGRSRQSGSAGWSQPAFPSNLGTGQQEHRQMKSDHFLPYLQP